MTGILREIVALWIVWCLMGCARLDMPVSNNTTEIVLSAPGARQVTFACSCKRFTPQPVVQKSAGTWSVRVHSDGDFSYFFIVDGRVRLPNCALKQQDDFGDQSCIFQFDP